MNLYYKLRKHILFRSYDTFGYITDNSEYGYRFLHHNYCDPGEQYVSKSGAVMLAALSREPRNIDNIVTELMNIFDGVEYDELKKDVEEFYNNLVVEGFLCSGSSADDCKTLTEDKENKITPDAAGNSSDAQIKPSDFLRALHIEIASECNERCIHCYIPHEDKLTLIDPDLFYKVVKDGRKMNIIHVTLSGGEPLLHPEFVSFLKYCRKMDLSVNVLSNLTLLDGIMIEEMKKNPLLSVQTSLYSMDPSVHDKITGKKGSFEKTKRAIREIVQSGIPVQISCPVMKENKDTFLDVVKWAADHNIGAVVQPQIYAQYDHTGKNLAHRLSVHEIAETVRKLLDAGYGDSWIKDTKDRESRRPQDPICSICRYMMCISATGTVYPCVGWQTNVINTLDNSTLYDIWNKSEKICALRQISRSQFPKCVMCKDRGYCIVCMMSNSNENRDGNPFRINRFHCEAAAAIHNTVNQYLKENRQG